MKLAGNTGIISAILSIFQSNQQIIGLHSCANNESSEVIDSLLPVTFTRLQARYRGLSYIAHRGCSIVCSFVWGL